jgi:glycosyltransferase involved in cell wall biosynthesis
VKLSILIPVYNEAPTLLELLDKVERVQLPGVRKEIVLVDDCSTDGSAKLLSMYQPSDPMTEVQKISHQHNSGKGAAIRTAIQYATGDYVLIQDADLEYDPEDYYQLLAPILKKEADVVYGNRFSSNELPSRQYWLHYLANQLLTWLSNTLTGLQLQDMECCYKLIPLELIRKMPLKENAFGFEPEVTAYLSQQKGIKIVEVPVKYQGRRYREGKKIGFMDGIRAVYCILRYNWK